MNVYFIEYLFSTYVREFTCAIDVEIEPQQWNLL